MKVFLHTLNLFCMLALSVFFIAASSMGLAGLFTGLSVVSMFYVFAAMANNH